MFLFLCFIYILYFLCFFLYPPLFKKAYRLEFYVIIEFHAFSPKPIFT